MPAHTRGRPRCGCSAYTRPQRQGFRGRTSCRGPLQSLKAWVCYTGVVPPSIAATFLARLDQALAQDRVGLSRDARDVAMAQFDWDEGDIFGLLHVLEEEDFHLTEPSTAEEGGVIWVFVPMTEEGRLWVRLCGRNEIIVVSFHRG